MFKIFPNISKLKECFKYSISLLTFHNNTREHKSFQIFPNISKLKECFKYSISLLTFHNNTREHNSFQGEN